MLVKFVLFLFLNLLPHSLCVDKALSEKISEFIENNCKSSKALFGNLNLGNCLIGEAFYYKPTSKPCIAANESISYLCKNSEKFQLGKIIEQTLTPDKNIAQFCNEIKNVNLLNATEKPETAGLLSILLKNDKECAEICEKVMLPFCRLSILFGQNISLAPKDLEPKIVPQKSQINSVTASKLLSQDAGNSNDAAVQEDIPGEDGFLPPVGNIQENEQRENPIESGKQGNVQDNDMPKISPVIAPDSNITMKIGSADTNISKKAESDSPDIVRKTDSAGTNISKKAESLDPNINKKIVSASNKAVPAAELSPKDQDSAPKVSAPNSDVLSPPAAGADDEGKKELEKQKLPAEDPKEPALPEDTDDYTDEGQGPGPDSPSKIVNKQPDEITNSIPKTEYRDTFKDAPDSHFFTYFLLVSGLCILFYVGVYNKKKLLALLIEGRRRNVKRRPNSAAYRKLDCNLEEAMASAPSTSSTNTLLY